MNHIRWVPDYPPAMITDDIAFVGGDPVSVHCLLAKDGLILLDTGYPDMLDGIAANLRTLGLSLQNVKYIVHSHGHIDHFGCTAAIVRLTGAKTFLGREDTAIASGEIDLSWAKELNLPHAETFVPDVAFADGDVLELGGRRIRCVHAPGHTAGTYALFIETSVNGEPMIAAMHGGVGTNSMTRDFLESYGLPLSCRDDFRASLRRLEKESVDIVLGNHPQQNDTLGKLKRMCAEENPFVDRTQWQLFLADCERQLDEMLLHEAM
jgi:metallo-beta-lactamase class B